MWIVFYTSVSQRQDLRLTKSSGLVYGLCRGPPLAIAFHAASLLTGTYSLRIAIYVLCHCQVPF